MEEIKKEEEKKIDLVTMIVPPHNKKSRKVTQEDMKKIEEDAKILFGLCFVVNGLYRGALAMHHSQIDNVDPLDFFVTADADIIINPEIIRHSNYTVDSVEGCMSFAMNEMTTVQRWHKIELQYQTITPEGKLSEVTKEGWSGKDAFMAQHEMGHGKGELIYPILDIENKKE